MLREIKKKVKAAKRPVFLGGAGVSTASGIPDFRSEKGLYAVKSEYGVGYETMLSHDYFLYHTKEFYSFYWSKMVYPEAKPNKAHLALASYEKSHHLVTITQNIDGLHQKAGSKIVLEVHGTTYSYHCMDCGKQFGLDELEHHGVPICPSCGGLIKPDVILYGENLDEDVLLSSIQAVRLCDLLIVGGTSLQVYPIASLPDYSLSATKILINLSPTPSDHNFDYVIHEDLGEALTKILED